MPLISRPAVNESRPTSLLAPLACSYRGRNTRRFHRHSRRQSTSPRAFPSAVAVFPLAVELPCELPCELSCQFSCVRFPVLALFVESALTPRRLLLDRDLEDFPRLRLRSRLLYPLPLPLSSSDSSLSLSLASSESLLSLSSSEESSLSSSSEDDDPRLLFFFFFLCFPFFFFFLFFCFFFFFLPEDALDASDESLELCAGTSACEAAAAGGGVGTKPPNVPWPCL